MSGKKSFRDNPALNFISPPSPPDDDIAGSGRPGTGLDRRRPSESPAAPEPRPAAAAAPSEAPAAGPRPARPKAVPAETRPPSAAPVPMKLNPLYIETKSKRVQLLMRPSLHRKLKAAAGRRGQSLNDLVHQILADWPGLEG